MDHPHLHSRSVSAALQELERADYSQEGGEDDGAETRHRLELTDHLVILQLKF